MFKKACPSGHAPGPRRASYRQGPPARGAAREPPAGSLASCRRGEQCDDGNQVDTDACTTLCKHAVCGDGFVQPPELCDDGNMASNDGCEPVCLFGERIARRTPAQGRTADCRPRAASVGCRGMTSDEALLAAWKDGDEDAGERLFDRYFIPVDRCARR
jgi:cysteine-rich repeat protein